MLAENKFFGKKITSKNTFVVFFLFTYTLAAELNSSKVDDISSAHAYILRPDVGEQDISCKFIQTAHRWVRAIAYSDVIELRMLFEQLNSRLILNQGMSDEERRMLIFECDN